MTLLYISLIGTLDSQEKGISSQEFAARNDLVLSLPERIQAIPDGTPAAPKQTEGWGASASHPEIKFDSGN
jgi:syntaxin of plants SYP7